MFPDGHGIVFCQSHVVLRLVSHLFYISFNKIVLREQWQQHMECQSVAKEHSTTNIGEYIKTPEKQSGVAASMIIFIAQQNFLNLMMLLVNSVLNIPTVATLQLHWQARLLEKWRKNDRNHRNPKFIVILVLTSWWLCRNVHLSTEFFAGIVRKNYLLRWHCHLCRLISTLTFLHNLILCYSSIQIQETTDY